MRYRLPEGCTGISLDGVVLEAADGFVEAAATAAHELAPHGIVPTQPEAPASDEKAKAKRTRT